jgi:hypothetical protein
MKGGDTWELLLKGADEQSVKNKLDLLGSGISSVSVKPAEDETLLLNFFIPDEDTGIHAGERIFDWAVAGSLKILGMSRKQISLEDIFVSLTQQDRNRRANNENSK